VRKKKNPPNKKANKEKEYGQKERNNGPERGRVLE
jgi:hypothetical protein